MNYSLVSVLYLLRNPMDNWRIDGIDRPNNIKTSPSHVTESSPRSYVKVKMGFRNNSKILCMGIIGKHVCNACWNCSCRCALQQISSINLCHCRFSNAGSGACCDLPPIVVPPSSETFRFRQSVLGFALDLPKPEYSRSVRLTPLVSLNHRFSSKPSARTAHTTTPTTIAKLHSSASSFPLSRT